MNFLQAYIDQQNNLHYHRLEQQVGVASLMVVIPCFNEPDILPTLNSLADCYPPKASVSVLVVVNDSEDASAEVVARNNSTLDSISQWQQEQRQLFFEVQRISARALPRKWAGVGWARKTGMDESVRQFVQSNFSDGIIVSLDADSIVMANYLQCIEMAFTEHPEFNFFTIHFEHPFDKDAPNSSIREAIIRYELHMRYYKNAMQWCGYPHAIHTVGSSFAVRASAYAKQGGMNRRKAGEDFYFLHKLVLLGPYGNISSTTVFPASRQSDRVPFGTGAAIKKWSEGSSELNYTYSLEPFQILKPFFASPKILWRLEPPEIEDLISTLHPVLRSYLEDSGTVQKILELRKNCSTPITFEKRFFDLNNAFWILKYLNFAHENGFSRANLQTEPAKLLQCLGIQTEIDISLENLLEIFRKIDKRVENCR